MAFSQIHTRSISLPSRLHPINSTQFEAQLDKLKSTVSLTSFDTIISGLVGLANLYNSIDTQAPSSLEETLERSVELLDCCGCIKEVAQMTRESVRALQSALRRKGSDNSSLRKDVASYVASRKRMSKCVKKSLKALKRWEGASDVCGLTAAVFRSALLFFSSSSSSSSSWNRVARLVLSKSEAVIVNEVGCVDLALSSDEFDKKMVQRSLQKLESCVDGIEEGLERIFRELVRSRVNLLNILTNH
ncbi:hypothetical protein SASPL_148532 [Salvia splendens]|uniref:Uncharacterized protein n=1 Tax=Salvia splendens TaxID=180675 RepID=A0A8X8W9G6_SALSN|nr:uncharacterized protein LOC121778993 [Salvia splendens]KAG6390787.1 hypothetical protein SASPL_148532 [Salvia splendens]